MPLDEAILSRNAETVRVLLHSSVILEVENGTTLCIVRSGSVDILNLYVDHLGARFSATAKYNMLLAASKHGQVLIIARLLSLPIDSNDSDCTKEDRWLAGRMLPWAQQSDNRKYTPLHIAAIRGDLKTTQLLVRHGFKADVATRPNQTPSHLAVQGGYMDVLRFLLCQKDMEVNRTVTVRRGKTLLHTAVQSGQIEMVKLLLDRADVDINCRDMDQRTPLHLASVLGDLALLQMLLRHERIELSAKDYSGLSALDLSALYGQWDNVQALLDHDEYGGAQTHVVQALEPHRLPPSDIVKRLLSHRDFWDINVLAGWNDDRYYHIGGLLHVAVRQGDCDILRVLLNRTEINVNCQSAYTRKTPLHLAAALGRKEIAKLLLQHKRIIVNLRTPEWFGETALRLAQLKGHAELAELLLAHGAVE